MGFNRIVHQNWKVGGKVPHFLGGGIFGRPVPAKMGKAGVKVSGKGKLVPWTLIKS